MLNFWGKGDWASCLTFAVLSLCLVLVPIPRAQQRASYIISNDRLGAFSASSD